ncbi:MAG TPA: universal stress protein [Gemmatimonadaceae bacterium]|jgi:nucleotide-binding universal stress UspA family protein|nr:universal stress protein [Gemmatimonadaceae bacterium]
MHRILVATQSQPDSDSALRVARAIAAREEATVLQTVLRHDRRAALAIAAEAEQQMVDLIVVGSGANESANGLSSGGIGLEIARWSTVPVLAVAPGSTGLPHTVVAATDFSPSSVNAARTAFELLDDSGTLSLVHACPDVELPPDALGDWRERYAHFARKLLARTMRQMGADDTDRVVPVELEGNPAEEIVAFATRVGADLIAAGNHSYHVVERLLVGSVATQLLRVAHCSVLLAPSGASVAQRELARQGASVTVPGVV